MRRRKRMAEQARREGMAAGSALVRCQHAYAQAMARAARAEEALAVVLGWLDRYPDRWRRPRTLPPPLPAVVAAAEAERARRAVELRATAEHADLEKQRAQAEMRREREEADVARRAAAHERRLARARIAAHDAEVANIGRQRATLARMVMAAMRAGGLTPTAKQLHIVSELSGLTESELRLVLPDGDRRTG